MNEGKHERRGKTPLRIRPALGMLTSMWATGAPPAEGERFLLWGDRMFPVKTRPYFCQKDWGGDRLRSLFGKPIPSPHTGESWEVSAHPSGECVVWGIPLSEAVRRYGRALLGDAGAPFPLLIKLLDARENLSVQVHPDDALAARLEGQPYGKTEAWYILDAPKDAELILGTLCGPEELRAAAERGGIGPCLRRLPVRAGDTVFIPAGTVHALTAGIVVYEVQQSSDTTYRLYAWGRDAELHVDQSLAAMEIGPTGAGVVPPRTVAPGVERLVACDAFTLDRLTPGGGMEIAADPSRFACYTALAACRLDYPGGGIDCAAGDSVLVPASAPAHVLRGGALLRALPVV